MQSMSCLALWLVTAAMMLVPETSHAHERCPDLEADVIVVSASPSEHALVCAGARQTLELLARCAIAPRDTLTVRVQPEVRHPLAGLIFGYYDLKERHAVLTSLASLPTLMEGTPYERLPPIEFYRSLIVHELVHGIMHQNLGQRTPTQAAYEYPAYALQIASLPELARAQFLRMFDQERLERPVSFNDTVLAFAPYFFAARAYRHFITSADGCARLRESMRGEIDIATDTAR